MSEKYCAKILLKSQPSKYLQKRFAKTFEKKLASYVVCGDAARLHQRLKFAQIASATQICQQP